MLTLALAAALAADVTLPVQGRVLDASGAAVHGTRDLTLALCPNPTPTVGETCTARSFPGTALTDGYFSVLLGEGGGLSHTTFDADPLYVAILVNGDELGPRQPVGSLRPRGGYTGAVLVDVPGNTLIEPTGGVTAVLLRFDGNYLDSSGRGHHAAAAGTARIQAEARIGTGSVRLGDGGAGYLTVSASPDFAVAGNQDFTIDMWLNYEPNESAAACQRVFQFGDNQSDGFGLMHCTTGDLYFGVAGGQAVGTPISALKGTGWHHLAITRASGHLRMFLDGAVVSSTTGWTSSNNGGRNLYISTYPGSVGNSSAYFMNGAIDDFRIHVGQAIYTANFTPPEGRSAAVMTIVNGMITDVQ